MCNQRAKEATFGKIEAQRKWNENVLEEKLIMEKKIVGVEEKFSKVKNKVIK